MLSIFASYRDLSFDAMALRLCLAVLCGGIIGLERTFRRRPAGFRTHMLICLGASMTTLTSQFLFLHMNYYTDMARIGAQVVAGIGFIGAGTIIVTRHQKVKGLTTAAGLWTCAIVGLALGAGFYEGALAVTAMVLLAEIVFSRLERMVLYTSPEVNLYVHYSGAETMEGILRFLNEKKIKVLSLQITRSIESQNHMPTAIIHLRQHPKNSRRELLTQLGQVEGIISVDDLNC